MAFFFVKDVLDLVDLTSFRNSWIPNPFQPKASPHSNAKKALDMRRGFKSQGSEK